VLRVPPMIAITDLVKTYGTFTAVDGVSLDVTPGEIHGFLGPNGAGKTTTLRMIAGLLKPTSGRILVNGHDLASQPEAAKMSLGFIPDRPFIYEKLTAGEFLTFHGGLYGLGEPGIGDRVREMLELFELGKWENELVESFSHGMKIIAHGTVAGIRAMGEAEDDQLTSVFLKLTGGSGLQEIDEIV
jgi:ABC-2 type transport system ATP-binding protein